MAAVNLDPQFCEMFPHVVKVKVTSGRNDYGEPTSSSTRELRAYVQPSLRLDHSANYETRNAGTSITIASTEIEPEDIVILPDGTERRVSSVVRYDFIKGMEHSIVEVA